MRGMRKKKLVAIFNELVQRHLIPPMDPRSPKLQWRRFKKHFLTGDL